MQSGCFTTFTRQNWEFKLIYDVILEDGYDRLWAIFVLYPRTFTLIAHSVVKQHASTMQGHELVLLCLRHYVARTNHQGHRKHFMTLCLKFLSLCVHIHLYFCWTPRLSLTAPEFQKERLVRFSSRPESWPFSDTTWCERLCSYEFKPTVKLHTICIGS